MGWFFANIIVPIIAPLLGALLFYCLPIPQRGSRRLSPLRTFKDGQLCWIAMAFSSAGLYELHGRDDAPWISWLLVVTLVLSSLLASGGALYQTSITVPANQSRLGHFRCLWTSLVLTLTSGACLTVAHFYSKLLFREDFMLKRWLARRFKDDESAKTTLSVLCGGGSIFVLLALVIGIAWDQWVQ